MLRPSQRFLVYGMPLPDISQLLDSKTLISSVSAIVGAIVGGLVTVLRNRVKTLEYTARHDRLAFAVNDARFGAVQVTWNGHNVVNLFSSHPVGFRRMAALYQVQLRGWDVYGKML